MSNRARLAWRWLGYIVAMAVLLYGWDEQWPQYRHVSPADWHWWLRAMMCAFIIVVVSQTWKAAREKDKKNG